MKSHSYFSISFEPWPFLSLKSYMAGTEKGENSQK